MTPDVMDGFSTWDVTPAQAYAQISEAASRCPVAYSSRHDGFHVALRYEDVKAAAFDWRRFSITPSCFRPSPPPGMATPLDLDPPAQKQWRAILGLAINTEIPPRLEPRIRADAHAAIDRFADDEQCDLVTEYAKRIPLHGICYALGVDLAYRDEFLQRALGLLKSGNDPAEFMQRYQDFTTLMVSLVEARKESDQADYLSQIARIEIDGQPLTPPQIAIATVHLVAPGFDTTVSGLSSLLYEVFSRPDLKARLSADHDLIPRAVEESLRLHPPIFGFFRRAVEATEMSGTAIEPNDDVYLCWAAANRDPEAFPDPLRFDIDRDRPPRHMSFGFGTHSCPGAPLARMQMRVALEAILDRLPDIELAEPGPPSYSFGGMETTVMDRLLARFRRKTPEPERTTHET